MSASWKITVPCTRAEAEAIDAGAIEIDAVLIMTETIVDDVEAWRLDAYFETEPAASEVAAVSALAPSAARIVPTIERIASADWVTMSQAGIEPLRVGRFVVHTSAYPTARPEGGRAFLIDAGQAFGTGHHETTAGCLSVLDDLAEQQFADIVDLGTGTGLLACAARHLWPQARVLASDIDPIAIDVTRENADRNRVERLDLLVADGAADPRIVERRPFDLIVANILAGPLIELAPDIAAIAAPGATIVLAGLLATQADSVAAAYEAVGCSIERVEARGEWTILRIRAATR